MKLFQIRRMFLGQYSQGKLLAISNFWDYGHFSGPILPFPTLMAIFAHQTVGMIVRILKIEKTFYLMPGIFTAPY